MAWQNGDGGTLGTGVLGTPASAVSRGQHWARHGGIPAGRAAGVLGGSPEGQWSWFQDVSRERRQRGGCAWPQ